MKRFVLLAMALFAGPALAASAPPIPPVYGVTASAAGVTVRLPASACAKKSDFTASVFKREPQSMVMFTPKTGRDCGPVQPGHLELVYSYEDLGLKPGEGFVLANPLAAEPAP